MEQDSLQPIIIANSGRRRPRPRRRFRPSVWVWRVLLGVAVVGGGGAVLSHVWEPYIMRHHQSLETLEIKQALAAAKEENNTLKRQLEMLKSGQGWDTEARRLGYIKKGEVPLQILYAPAPRQRD